MLQNILLWLHNVAGDSKIYVVRHVEFPIFLLYFNQIWSFSTSPSESPLSNLSEIRLL